MPEYLDVRDYYGNKRGIIVERGKHQHEDWWYLCVHVYIMTSDGNFLIQQRAMAKEYFPGIWDITCGAALSGEDSVQAAIRETKEELGLDVSDFERTFLGTSHCYDCVNHIYLFRGNFKLSDLKLQEEEVMNVKLVPKDQLLDLIKNSEFKDEKYYDAISDFLKDIS